jgi:2OG-Fe(II) oxygenase superfamily
VQGRLLERVRRELDAAEFEEHTGIRTELRMRSDRALALLEFLANDPEFFEAVREITGCDRIGAFLGRVYRMLPGPEHEGVWHADLVHGRMVAMSVNLSDAPYSGGLLEIRDEQSDRVLHRIANTGPGDAVIFRLAEGLKHRLTGVEGKVPKTAYAGWFLSGPESELLHPADFLSAAPVG